MADALVPIGRHFFTPSDIERLAATIPPDTTATVIGKAAIDTEGVRVAVLFTPKGGHFVARAAWEYDWDEGQKVGADLTFKF